jgi:endonuclease-8
MGDWHAYLKYFINTMPEGPSIILLKEEVKQFTGRKILSVSGNSKIDQQRLFNQTVIAFKSWGKHFLICFKKFSLRIHFLMWGSYKVNDKKPDRPIRLHLKFKNGEINFYSCSIKILEGDVNSHYDWSSDVMNDQWDASSARKKLKSESKQLVCDALLDQHIFSGVGNIIKNEVLYRIRVHPESIVKKIPSAKIRKMIEEARNYSFQFLEWKRNYELKKHWLAHTKKICLRCDLLIKKKHTGFRNRRSFFCTNCQLLYK